MELPPSEPPRTAPLQSKHLWLGFGEGDLEPWQAKTLSVDVRPLQSPKKIMVFSTKDRGRQKSGFVALGIEVFERRPVAGAVSRPRARHSMPDRTHCGPEGSMGPSPEPEIPRT